MSFIRRLLGLIVFDTTGLLVRWLFFFGRRSFRQLANTPEGTINRNNRAVGIITILVVILLYNL